MNLIDWTYLQENPCFIPVFDETSNDGEAVIAEIDNFISDVQPEILSDILGVTLYYAFMEGMEEDDPDERWEALADQIRNDTTKKSLLIPFVYFEHLTFSKTITTEAGEMTTAAANAQRAENTKKAAKIFNMGVKMAIKLDDWLNESEDYPERDATNMKYFININSMNL